MTEPCSPDKSVAIGCGTLIAIVVASGIFWWTAYRFVRWIVW